MSPFAISLCSTIALAAGATPVHGQVSAQPIDPDLWDSSGQWHRVGPPLETAGRTMTPKIEIFGTTPFLTFQDAGLECRGSAAVLAPSGLEWVYLGGPGQCSDHQDWWAHLAVGPDQTLYRASYEYGLNPIDGGNGLNLRQFLPGANLWTRLGTLPLSPGQSHIPDVEVDSHGHVLISYQDGPDGGTPVPGDVTVQCVDAITGEPRYLGPAGFSRDLVPENGLRAWTTSLEISSTDEVWAAWEQILEVDDKEVSRAAVARFDATSDTWALVDSVGLGVGVWGAGMNLKLDGADRPYLATFSYAQDSRGIGTMGVYVFRLDDSGQRFEQVGPPCGVEDHVMVSDEAGYREICAFELDEHDIPYVAYRGGEHGKKACVRRYDADLNDWVPVGVLGFSPGEGVQAEDDYISLAISGGVPFVAFRHGCSSADACDPPVSSLEVWAFF